MDEMPRKKVKTSMNYTYKYSYKYIIFGFTYFRDGEPMHNFSDAPI